MSGVGGSEDKKLDEKNKWMNGFFQDSKEYNIIKGKLIFSGESKEINKNEFEMEEIIEIKNKKRYQTTITLP